MPLTEEQKKNRPWLYQKGQSGNPGGRPKGSKSLKTYVKEKLEKMSDEEKEEFIDGLDKKVLWEMSEGRPDTKSTLDAKVEHSLPEEQAAIIKKALEDI